MIKVNCPKCKHYLFETEGTLIAENVKCSYCKDRVNIKIVTSESAEKDIRYKFMRANNASSTESNKE